MNFSGLASGKGKRGDTLKTKHAEAEREREDGEKI